MSEDVRIQQELKEQYREAERDRFAQNPGRSRRMRDKHTRYWLLGPLYRRLYPSPPERFLVICRGRTGSHFLLTMLESHQRIRQVWEPFDVEGNPLRKRQIEQMGPLDYLNEKLRRVADEKLVGFKILYHQYDEEFMQRMGLPSLEPVRSFVEHDLSLKVIHLKRRNMLRTLVSSRIADRTRSYIIFNDSRRDQTSSLELSPEQCEAEFVHIEETQQRLDETFRAHNRLELYYENLVDPTASESLQVQKFLGVRPGRLEASTVRQNVRPLSEVITNYGSLKQHFSGTRWAWMFDD